MTNTDMLKLMYKVPQGTEIKFFGETDELLLVEDIDFNVAFSDSGEPEIASVDIRLQ